MKLKISGLTEIQIQQLLTQKTEKTMPSTVFFD
jgi:hypothetical protein